MFDPVTVALINQAPPLNELDLEALPQRFTNAYAEIVAARVRLKGLKRSEQKSDSLKILIDEMERLAATQEALIAADPERLVALSYVVAVASLTANTPATTAVCSFAWSS